MEITTELESIASLVAEHGPYVICLVFMFIQNLLQSRNHKEQMKDSNEKVNKILTNIDTTLKTLSENIIILNERVSKGA